MTAPFPFGVTVEVKRGTRNKFGDVEYSDVDPIPGCAFDPGTSSEDNDGRTTVIDRPKLLGPYGADLQSDDTVVIPGPGPEIQRTYRVIGRVRQWRNPFNGATPGFDASLEAVS